MISLFKIAWRNVSRNTRRTLISVFAIFIGIGVNVTIRGFMNGLQGQLVRNVVGGRMGALQIHHEGYVASIEGVPLNLDMPFDAALLAKLAALPGVTGAAPRITFPVIVSKGDETVFALGSAIDPAAEYKICPTEAEVVSVGAPLGGGPGMLMSTQLASALKANVGDMITLLGNDKDGLLNGIELKLAGTYTSRVPGLEKTIIATLPEVQGLLRMEGRITEIALGMANPRAVDALVPSVVAALPPGHEVHTWQQLAKSITDIMKFQNTFLGVASAVFLLVALTLIVNTMLMAVLERVREIGTMMAVGVRRRQVLGLFLMESGLLGLIGGIVGALAGWGVVTWMGWRGIELSMPGVKATNILRPEIGLSYLALMVAVTIAGAVVAAVYPAWNASRLRPVEALQSV
ncbi:MAG TPA: FtsX-like permease family protein [Myxococcota bacterium]|jgi:putative ABC transport system permease protein|nr:FtsX-like permease family protein [Myxococcota bacterium]